MYVVEYIDNLKIEDFFPKVAEAFVEMFSQGTKDFKKLDYQTQVRIKHIIEKGMSEGKLGEILASTWLIDDGYDIGWSNIRINMPNDREEDGIDLLAKKGNHPFYIEVKTGYLSNKKSALNSAKYSAFAELKKRMSNFEAYLASMERIKWLDPNDRGEFNRIVSTAKPIALLSTKVPESDNPFINTSHDIQMTILGWQHLDALDLHWLEQSIKGAIDE